MAQSPRVDARGICEEATPSFGRQARACELRDRSSGKQEPQGSARAIQLAGLILGVPFRARPAHVVEFGPVGIARDPDQCLPFAGDEVQGLAEQGQ